MKKSSNNPEGSKWILLHFLDSGAIGVLHLDGLDSASVEKKSPMLKHTLSRQKKTV
jgi:hypothetical protein